MHVRSGRQARRAPSEKPGRKGGKEMPIWAWAVIGVAAATVVALVIWQLISQQLRHRLRERFGSEYERTVEASDSRREAEADLREREEHRARLNISPMAAATRDRYRDNWQEVQAQFVDNPAAAVAAADSLIQMVMVERGYPVEDFEQRSADISVDHPDVVENYRDGHPLAQLFASGDGRTEDARRWGITGLCSTNWSRTRTEPETWMPTQCGATPREAIDRFVVREVATGKGREADEQQTTIDPRPRRFRRARHPQARRRLRTGRRSQGEWASPPR